MRTYRHLTPALLGAAVIIMPAAASAQVAQQATATVDLNLRAGPGPEYSVISVIPSMGAVTVYGCITGSEWCDVAYQDDRGWAYSAYLTFDMAGNAVAIPNIGTQVAIPTVTFDATAAATTTAPAATTTTTTTTTGNNGAGVVAGIAGGAAAGAVLGGPVGAIIGAIAGATLGAAVSPPQDVTTYVTQQQVQPVLASGEVVVGAGLPEAVTLYPIPNYQYQFADVNGQRVLVDPQSRQIVYIFR